ncbi:MAG: hypothetical protein KGP35_01875 [Bacteroidetes bacterium]|nr:hypothetical protein [Bacteroidota bacterium]
MGYEKVLIVQLFSNGDCMYVTAIARQIKYNNPKAHITWAVSAKCKAVLLGNPDIDVVEEVQIPDVSQNEKIFMQVVADAHRKKQAGVYEKIIIPQLLGDNLKYYDGIVSSSLFRSAGCKITVDPSPRIYLSAEEHQAAAAFAQSHQLHTYRQVILFECAPQTNQLSLTDNIILRYAALMVQQESTCVILSAPRAYNFNVPHIIDGNSLSIRETIALTHYCTLLLGCSSGISWGAVSIAAKPIPLVQILSPDAYYFNPLSITLKRWGKSTDNLIELVNFDDEKLKSVFKDIFLKGFSVARRIHSQPVSVQFRLHRGIVHHFLIQGKFAEIITFVKINLSQNGFNLRMMMSIALGFLFFPLQLISDQIKKY